MARPPVEIDMDKLATLMRFKPTAEDCAAFFKCSIDTIERRIRNWTTSDECPEGLSFAAFREQNMVHTRMSLVKKALEKASKGDNVMLIFCLKNLCGWKDKQPGEEPTPTAILNNVQVTDDQLANLVRVARGETK